MITANTNPSVSVAQQIAPIPNQPLPAQVRISNRPNQPRLDIPAEWPQFDYTEVLSNPGTTGVKKILLPIHPALWRRRFYLYNFTTAAGAFTQDIQAYFAWDETKLTKFPVYNSNAAGTTQSLPIFPIGGGNVVQNSIQLLIANPLPAETLSVILQPYEFELAANKLIVDVNALTGAPNYRVWVGCFSY